MVAKMANIMILYFLARHVSINQKKTETEKQAERENVLWGEVGGHRK